MVEPEVPEGPVVLAPLVGVEASLPPEALPDDPEPEAGTVVKIVEAPVVVSVDPSLVMVDVKLLVEIADREPEPVAGFCPVVVAVLPSLVWVESEPEVAAFAG